MSQSLFQKTPKGYNFYGHFSSEKIFSLISSNAYTNSLDPVLNFIEPSPLLLNHHALVLVKEGGGTTLANPSSFLNQTKSFELQNR